MLIVGFEGMEVVPHVSTYRHQDCVNLLLNSLCHAVSPIITLVPIEWMRSKKMKVGKEVEELSWDGVG